jgi:hypothetical protein
MSQNLSLTVAAVLVRALLVVEHDREKHIPGVKTGPNAETFLVPEDVASSLVAAGAVERVEAVVDTDQLLDAPATTAVDNAKVVTFADAADLIKLDAALAELQTSQQRLEEAAASNADLAQKLAELQAERDALAESLAQAQAGASADKADGADATAAAADTSGQAAKAAETPAVKTPAAKSAKARA